MTLRKYKQIINHIPIFIKAFFRPQVEAGKSVGAAAFRQKMLYGFVCAKQAPYFLLERIRQRKTLDSYSDGAEINEYERKLTPLEGEAR